MICLQMLMNRRARLEAVAIQCDRFIQIREIGLLWWSLWTIDVARFTAIFFHFARFCNAFDWRRRQLVWFSISLTHYSVMIFVRASQTRFAYILRLHFIRFESLSRLVLVRIVAANINWLVVVFFGSVVISFCLLGFANIFVWFSANWFLFTSFCCHKFDGKLTEKTECSWKVSVWKFSIDFLFRVMVSLEWTWYTQFISMFELKMNVVYIQVLGNYKESNQNIHGKLTRCHKKLLLSLLHLDNFWRLVGFSSLNTW